MNKMIMKYAKEFIENGKWISERGLAIGTGGNLSVRIPGGMLITATHSPLSDLKSDDVVFVTSVDSDSIYFIGNKKPSIETIMHWKIYNARPDVFAAAHVNVGPLEDKNILISDHEIIYGTGELADDTANFLKESDIVMMKYHGLVAVGKNLHAATNLVVDSADKEKPYIYK